MPNKRLWTILLHILIELFVKTLMTYQCILDIPLILLSEKTTKSCCCNESSTHYNLPLCKYIRDQGHWHNWDMVLTETKFCDSLLEVKKYEQELIDLMKPNVNIARPFVTDDDLKGYRQTYYQENIDTIKPKREQEHITENIYRENNKETFLIAKIYIIKKTKSM